MQLRDYQQKAIDSIYDYFTKHDGNPLVVCPTASGKSVISGSFIQGVVKQWPNQRIMMVTHVKELVEQNYEKLRVLWPEAPAGLYSAQLKRRDTMFPITVASIQSVYKKSDLFGWVDLLMIDEAHLLSPKDDGMYMTFITGLKRYNPKLKVIGLTATPFRTKGGMLTTGEKRIFTDICYEISIKYLLEQKYLCPLRSKSAINQVDMTGVRTMAGEFNQKDQQERMMMDGVTELALREAMQLATNRKSWLLFGSGVEHAYQIANFLNKNNIKCEVIEGSLPVDERDQIINKFKSGKIQAISNYNVLTTGFDAPNVDNIVLLRATKSAGLYIQMLGRGMRLHPDKDDCLVLDYGGNIERFGPIDQIQIKDPTFSGKGGVPPTKSCPECLETVFTLVRHCPACGYEWPAIECDDKLDTEASDGQIISEANKPEIKKITEITYNRHEKTDKLGNVTGSPSMVVTYKCGLMEFKEWVCFEHTGYPKQKAMTWWFSRDTSANKIIPKTVAEALNRIEQLREPTEIVVQKQGKHWQIMDYMNFREQNRKEDEPWTNWTDLRISTT